MALSNLEETSINSIKNAIATLKRAQRDYRIAIKRIERAEQFLSNQIESLGYESRHLYGSFEPIHCPPVPVSVGLSVHTPRSYVLFFRKDESAWYFYLAPTTEHPEGGTQSLDDKAMRLKDAPAAEVIYCAEMIESHVANILEYVAAAVVASSSTARPIPSRNESKKGANGKAPTQAQQKAAIH